MLSNQEFIILKHLRKNSRGSLAKLARQEDIPVSTLFSKVSHLESKIIKKNTCLIDFSKIGFGLMIFLFIKTDSKKEVLEFLSNHPNTNCLSKINNGYDFVLEAVFNNMKAYTKFCDDLKKINVKIDAYFAVEELKKEDFLTREGHLELFG